MCDDSSRSVASLWPRPPPSVSDSAIDQKVASLKKSPAAYVMSPCNDFGIPSSLGHPSSFADIARWILNFAPALIIKW